jgi:hypothetical protein
MLLHAIPDARGWPRHTGGGAAHSGSLFLTGWKLQRPHGRQIALDSRELVKLLFKPALCRNGRGGRRVGWSGGVLAGAGCSSLHHRSLDFSRLAAAEGFLCGMSLHNSLSGDRDCGSRSAFLVKDE